MATFLQNIRQQWNGRGKPEPHVRRTPGANRPHLLAPPALDIKPNDPLVAFFLKAPGAVDIDKLHLDSPALGALKASGVQLVIPLVSQDELVGLLNLGPRRSEQNYSSDDRGLLNALAIQAAPAVRAAQLVREQQAQARARERLEQELRVARLIQQTLLPKALPALPGWQLDAYYQPAREVGGDFYDFVSFEDGRLGIVIGDVTDKGVPADLIMATTRSILRAAAQRLVSPGSVFLLEQLLAFTGPQWEQEDDVTLVILQRAEEGGGSEIVTHLDETVRSASWRRHARLTVACGLSEHYVEIFQITRLIDFMSVFPDETSALVEEPSSLS